MTAQAHRFRLAAFFCCLAVWIATPVAAAPPSPEIGAALTDVVRAGLLLDATRGRAQQSPNTTEAAALHDQLDEARTRAAGAAVVIAPELARVSARIGELGSPAAGQGEAPDIVARRRALEATRADLDSALKRANLIQVEADQARNALTARQAQASAERINQRTRSPLSPSLWTAALDDAPRLELRLAQMQAELSPADNRWTWALAASLAVSTALISALAIGLHALGRRYTARRSAAQTPLLRSAFAAWTLLIGSAAPALAGLVIVVGLQVGGAAPSGVHLLATSVVVALVVGAFVIALTNALLLVDRPDWRLARIDTNEARQLRPFGWIAAVAIVLATTSDAFITFIAPPASIATAIQAAIALLCVGLVIGLLVVVGRIRAHDDGQDGGNVLYGRLPTLALIVLWPGSLYLLYRGAAGYVVYATETALWLVWGGVVLLTFYLLARLIDDACLVVFTHKSRFARSAHARFGVKDNTLSQFGVLMSAALRLGLVVIAGAMLLVPFGTGFTSFLDLFGRLGQGVRIGPVTVSPTAIVRAVAVLVISLAIFNIGRRWLIDRYLPTTSLDAGAVNSIGVITGYLGVTVAVLWALVAFGVQVQQLAFLVSALSVGIGFGLQAITQNFVSGLILLTERPVRIGERVKVGDQSGRVERISVRATRLVADDGSRVMVPNAELITKTVVSGLAQTPATVRGELAVDFALDLDRVRDLILATIADHPAARGAASLNVGDVRDGLIVLVWSAAAAPGADLERVRGEIWLAIIRTLKTNGVDIRPPPAVI